MNLTITFQNPEVVPKLFKEVGVAVGKQMMNKALLSAVKSVMIPEMKKNAPVHSGATKRDIRAKVVDGKNPYEARVIAGVDARKGRAGWYTHLIVFKGQKVKISRSKSGKVIRDRGRRNDFIERSAEATKGLVISIVDTELMKVLNRYKSKLV